MYLVLKQLGEGANGAVYRCKNDKIGPDAPVIAIKILYYIPTDAADKSVARFARERDLMREVDHPNVLKCLDYGKHAHHPYMVLEFANGGSVFDYMEKRKRLSERMAAWIAWQTIAGLRAVGTVHRDLKPENLMLVRGAGQEITELVVGDIEAGTIVKVADWGLAMDKRTSPQRLTLTNEIFGTPYYMSPEQARKSKDVTPHTDMYALGCMLYEMVVGTPPFLGEHLAIMYAHCNEWHQFPDDVPVTPAFRAIIDRCMQKEVRDRFASFRELQEALRPFLELPRSWVYYGGAGTDEGSKSSAMAGMLRQIRGWFS